MICVTGDIHGRLNDIKDLYTKGYSHIIILGDFGIIWSNEPTLKEMIDLEWLSKQSTVTLFIDGNHENHKRLNSYPIEIWNGGKVHKITHNVYHLMRGQVFNIEGKSFFAFGGARSHDISDGILEVDDPRIEEWSRNPFRMFRIRNLSWWEEEEANKGEMLDAFANLQKNGNKVDYVLTHCAPSGIAEEVIRYIGCYEYEETLTSSFLQCLLMNLDFDKWLFGHYHINGDFREKWLCLFEEYYLIEEAE